MTDSKLVAGRVDEDKNLDCIISDVARVHGNSGTIHFFFKYNDWTNNHSLSKAFVRFVFIYLRFDETSCAFPKYKNHQQQMN